MEIKSIFGRVGLPVFASKTHKEEPAYEIYSTRVVTPSDDRTYVTYALSPLTAGAKMTMFTKDNSELSMVQQTNIAEMNLLKSKLFTQSIEMRGKFYVLRPVRLVLLTPVLVSLVIGFGLAKER